MTETTDIVVASSPLSLISALTAEDVLEGFAPVSEWRYSFKQGMGSVQGLTADGIQDGVRQMARKGEAIRCIDVRLEKDDADFAFFIAHAGRYAISPDGSEVLLDSTIRGKRIAKRGNEFWFEQGLTKAARNAEEALMPQALKAWMLARAAEFDRPQASRAPTPVRQQAPRPSPAPVGRLVSTNIEGTDVRDMGPAPSSPDAAPPADWKPQQGLPQPKLGAECEHVASEKLTDDGRIVCKLCGTLL